MLQISGVLAPAWKYDATIWTQDGDFDDVPEVRYVTKGKAT